MATMDFNFFITAAQVGDIFVLKKGLDSGIDIHICDDLALRLTIENNHSKASIFLLANGANIQAVYNAELRRASLEGETDTVITLLKNDLCSQESKIYAMYNAIFAKHEDIIKLLLPFAHNEAVLNVVRLCDNEKINILFKDFLQ